MLLILDTHAVLWWTLDSHRLGKQAARALAEAERVGIPAIALWEVSVLVRKRKVHLDLPLAEWAERVLAIPRVEALPLDAAVALRADGLEMHGDPADRFIVAIALEHRARLATKDALLRKLTFLETVW
ncbi:MAG TPA: type II toxin-antitoxin system VapC family toxin [Polyangia bacterium]|nr:type II toxin-antitoxin system VapC family toxin [Polyangia bacterium]